MSLQLSINCHKWIYLVYWKETVKVRFSISTETDFIEKMLSKELCTTYKNPVCEDLKFYAEKQVGFKCSLIHALPHWFCFNLNVFIWFSGK